MKPLMTTLAIAVSLLFAAPVLADEAGIEGIVAKKAATLKLLHRKSKKALVNAAQDNSFAEYFSAHSDDGRSRIKERIDRISLHVQSRFHVEEMCLINVEGAEVSRIVGKEIADDLALDEADAIFFKPGFEQNPRKAYVSPTYMSPDADKWVIAYVTPILAAREKKAILHYEHTLAVYQDVLHDAKLAPRLQVDEPVGKLSIESVKRFSRRQRKLGLDELAQRVSRVEV